MWIPDAKGAIFGSDFGNSGGMGLALIQASGAATGMDPAESFFSLGMAASLGAVFAAIGSSASQTAVKKAMTRHKNMQSLVAQFQEADDVESQRRQGPSSPV